MVRDFFPVFAVTFLYATPVPETEFSLKFNIAPIKACFYL